MCPSYTKARTSQLSSSQPSSTPTTIPETTEPSDWTGPPISNTATSPVSIVAGQRGYPKSS